MVFDIFLSWPRKPLLVLLPLPPTGRFKKLSNVMLHGVVPVLEGTEVARPGSPPIPLGKWHLTVPLGWKGEFHLPAKALS